MSKGINELGFLDGLDELQVNDIKERVLEMSNEGLGMDEIRGIVQDIIAYDIPRVIS